MGGRGRKKNGKRRSNAPITKQHSDSSDAIPHTPNASPMPSRNRSPRKVDQPGASFKGISQKSDISQVKTQLYRGSDLVNEPQPYFAGVVPIPSRPCHDARREEIRRNVERALAMRRLQEEKEALESKHLPLNEDSGTDVSEPCVVMAVNPKLEWEEAKLIEADRVVQECVEWEEDELDEQHHMKEERAKLKAVEIAERVKWESERAMEARLAEVSLECPKVELACTTPRQDIPIEADKQEVSRMQASTLVAPTKKQPSGLASCFAGCLPW